MAEVCHRLAEFIAAIITLLVVTAFFDYVRILSELVVDVGKEALVYLELRQDVVLVDLIILDLRRYLEGVG